MSLGNKILEHRKKLNLSQEQLAEKLNVTRQTISKWELDETTPDIRQAQELSKLFKISLDDLTGNNIKNILIEKMNNSEKITNTVIKTIKFISIIFLILVIIDIITFIIFIGIK